jgi:hypothetical protein
VSSLFENEACRSAVELLAEAQNRETNLISHRMTWLMTLNGFLVAGVAALLASRDKFERGAHSDFAAWRWLVTGIAIGGLVSNLSTLYSNYWADRALQGADAAYMNVVSQHVDVRAARRDLRLAGRDPENMPRLTTGSSDEYASARFFTPFAKILHPWFLLPAVFGLGFFILPSFEFIGHHSFWGKFGVQIAVIVVMGSVIWLSHRLTPRRDFTRRVAASSGGAPPDAPTAPSAAPANP